MENTSFVLVRPLRVVHLSEALKGMVAVLPAGARVSITGFSTLPDFVEVVCANVHYNVFEEDLRDRGSEQVIASAAS